MSMHAPMAIGGKEISSTTTTNLPYRHKPEDCSIENTPTSKLSQKTVLHLLNTKCGNSLQYLKQVHGVVLRRGHFQDHYVAGTLVKCYANPQICSLDFALKVFGHVYRPNIFVWNTVLKACLEHDEACKVIYFYHKLVEVSYSRPNKFTYPLLLKACAVEGAAKEGVQVHGHVVKHGLSRDGHIRSAGIQMYASYGYVEEARRLLEEDGDCDTICWNAMIDGYLKCGDVEAAKELFEKMSSKNVGSWNAMVSGFGRCGMVEDARKMFDEMIEKDEISWSAMVDGYIKTGCYKEVLETFNEMQRKKVRPKKFILSSVLAACANLGALDQGRWIHAYARKNSIKLDAVLGTALVDMYAKCGHIDLAWDVFENMKEKEVFSWNAMMGGLAMHGRAEDAIELFFKMLRERVLRPNGITLVCVLNACAHAGWVDKGLNILNSMQKIYGVEPEMEHYGCVVDLLGRAGLLREAEELIASMPMKPNAAVWGALLGACRIHKNVELGERIGKILLEMDPLNSGRYALLSNIYAKAGRWEDVGRLRKLMKGRGIRTTPGISMIDLDGIIHEFKMGDGSHPQVEEIHMMLEKIIEKLQREGYSPNTSQVLFDISEEEKETALKYHSEKLAIAFGLLNTKPGTPIRIIKNLRVCEDCHSATKIISRVYRREIIVRDRVRYHYFKNGVCSCKDFW